MRDLILGLILIVLLKESIDIIFGVFIEPKFKKLDYKPEYRIIKKYGLILKVNKRG